MSDRACIQSNGKLQPILSGSNVLSCCGIVCGKGCKGGFPKAAIRYMARKGICTGGRYGEKVKHHLFAVFFFTTQ
ncbi:unnamed protein product [Strongylus vulgaris]|uniref:Peptidase C1A papain C-terminal domain-containing protein n=1 Tax=Strongylus vulgaris TaxID=40348 RepID=A0A3P7KKY4_STRVU|nr:unnamed protein product [Strongylus vulgaris]